MNIQLRLPKRQIVTVISQLSQEINDQKQANSLIVCESSYQVIPGYLQSYIHNIDNIIRWLLPHSKSRLIEITLPFTYLSNNLQQTRILGKYILFDRKLRGIRISLNNKHVIELPKYMSPSPLLQQYYRQNRINFNKNQILIGDFYLQMMNYRVGLFFQDELVDFPSFKNTYEKYRFDIISVMSNIQKRVDRDDNVFSINYQQRDIHHRLKTLSKQNKITVLFAGIKIVPNQRIVYWEKSFMIQDVNFIAQPKSLFGEKNFIAMIANVELSLQKKWQFWRSKQNIQVIEDENEKYLEKLQINMKFKQAENCPSVPVISLNNKNIAQEFFNKKQQMVYNLWYLYRTVNKSTPFVIPFPFSKKRQKLYSLLLNLSQHCNKDITQLTLIYRYKVDNSVSKYSFQIYNSFQQMLAQNRNKFSQLIYLFCEDPDQIKRLRINDQYGNRICNCQSLIPNTQNESIQIQNNQRVINKKIENLCNHVLKERFQNIQQILHYFWDNQLNRMEIQKCFSQILPNKVKKFFKLTPHYLFFLQSTPQEIINEIGEAEFRLKSREKSRVMYDENDSSINYEQFPKRLVERIEATRKYKNSLNLLSKCHRCDFRFKKDLLQRCNMCSSFLCFDCIDVLTNHSLFELNQYKCAICLKLCKCNKCKKVIPAQKINKQASEEKNSSFRFSECGKCLILDSKYDKIQIECTQCKKLKCYNCAKAQKTFQISKMSTWICRDCYQLNEDFINKQQQKEYLISLQVDQNDMNQEIIEESVSRSASPVRIVEEAGKGGQTDKKTQKAMTENKYDKKISQKSNELNIQKFEPVNNQLHEKVIIQQSKNDKFNKNNKHFNTNLEQDTRFNQEREIQRQKSRQRNRSRSKEKKKVRSLSSQSSKKSHRKQNNHKKNKLWGFEKKEKEHKREKSTEKSKQRQRCGYMKREKEKNKKQHRGKIQFKMNKNSQSQKKKRKSSSKESSPVPIRNPPPIPSGFIFQVNPRKETPESQQQSY